MSNKRTFKHGDLVQIKYGNEPLGIIVGEPKPRYEEHSFNTHTGKFTGTANCLVYPVMISDIDETSKNQYWYWSGGLYYSRWDSRSREVNIIRDDINPLIAYIHPIYLTLLSES